VSDLNDELRHLANEAARQAQPLPVEDVIQQGDRRYRRAVASWPPRRARTPGLATQARPGRRWSRRVAPLAAAAAVIAVVAGTAAVSSAIHGRRSAAGTSPAHRAIAYVVNSGSGTVTPIRTATNTPLPPIKTGYDTAAIAITPDGKTAYAVNMGYYPNTPGTVTPIRTATNTALPPIKIGAVTADIAITPDGKTAYVPNEGSSTVIPIRTATNTPLPPIKTGLGPNSIAITPDGKTAYVTNSSSGTVTPIRTATSTPLPPIKTGLRPIAIAITP
jgi:YVTN family beta-propeller protein